MSKPGILTDLDLAALARSGGISAPEIEEGQIQPASLDLRLGTKAYRLRASFLPGPLRRVEECLASGLVMHEVDLAGGAVLETGCVYLVPLMESLALPADLSAAMNPKSSTGRLDVFTRVIGNNAAAFDQLPAGYEGPLWVEISPRTFSILARPGDRLVQVRLRRGAFNPGLSQVLSVDLEARGNAPVGWRAKTPQPACRSQPDRGSPRAGILGTAPCAQRADCPGSGGVFTFLPHARRSEIPLEDAAEMAPVAPEIGEFRAHYAGFFLIPDSALAHRQGPCWKSGDATCHSSLKTGRQWPGWSMNRWPAKWVQPMEQAAPTIRGRA